MARLGGLAGRMTGAYLGQGVRRVLADSETKDRLRRRLQLDNAERVVETVGRLKGAAMKVGQSAAMMATVLELPEEVTQVLERLHEKFSHRLALPPRTDRSDEIVVHLRGRIRFETTEEGLLTVTVTAHDVHFGVGEAIDGDSIYNGAYDNASGTALIMALASSMTEMENGPERSVLFIATAAEEQGLLGAQWYVQSPLFPLARTVAELNVDGANLWGETRDVTAQGE